MVLSSRYRPGVQRLEGASSDGGTLGDVVDRVGMRLNSDEARHREILEWRREIARVRRNALRLALAAAIVFAADFVLLVVHTA